MFNLKFPLAVVLRSATLLAVAWGASACTTPEVCKDLGTCGGNLVDPGQTSKTWNIGGACLNQEASAPSVPSLIHQAPTLAGEAAPHRTEVNFCSEMILKPDKSIKILQPWFPSLPVQTGSINFTSSFDFTASINYFSPHQEMDFAAGCFLSQGFKIVPQTTTVAPDTMTCQDFKGVLATYLETQPNFSNVNCADDAAGGCQCQVDLLLITAVSGKYAQIGSVVNFYDSVANNPVSSADYCVRDDQLDLSGYKRTFLFNQPALRSLVLTAD